ncbi:MAG: hypothetical protein AB1668_06185, partial [Nanoarchaeota archaeon]
LSSRYGPRAWEGSISFPLDARVIQEKDEKDGLLIWNGNLPVVYTQGLVVSADFLSRLQEACDTDATIEYLGSYLQTVRYYAPPSLSESSSVAIVVGNDAVVRLFSLDKADGITDTGSLYQAVLAKEFRPEIYSRLLERWSQNVKGSDDISIFFDPLEKRIETMVKEFFEKDIFARYGVAKPDDYNLPPVQRMLKLVEQGRGR